MHPPKICAVDPVYRQQQNVHGKNENSARHSAEAGLSDTALLPPREGTGTCQRNTFGTIGGAPGGKGKHYYKEKRACAV